MLFYIHLSATLLLCGIIWFVQLIHYPLFVSVGRSAFEKYEKVHTQRVFRLIAPLMFIELSSGILLFAFPPFKLIMPLHLLGFVFLILIWVSTFLIQTPIHSRLLEGFKPKALRMLIMTNWIRTLAWTLRAIIVVLMISDWEDVLGL